MFRTITTLWDDAIYYEIDDKLYESNDNMDTRKINKVSFIRDKNVIEYLDE